MDLGHVEEQITNFERTDNSRRMQETGMMMKCARMKALKPKYEILTVGIKLNIWGAKMLSCQKSWKTHNDDEEKRKIRMDDEHSNG